MTAANIILVGFMGTGKSAVGRLLAEKMRRQFVDMDALIEERAGKPISRIFAEEDEARFRQMERGLVIELAGRSGLVIAAGGGVVLNPDNIRDFSRTGQVVCLAATPEEILRRVKDAARRPLLAKSADKLAEIRRLLQVRQPRYDAIPHRIDTTGKTVAEVAEDILHERFSKRGTAP